MAEQREQTITDRNQEREEGSSGSGRKQKSQTERTGSNVRGAARRAGRVLVARQTCVCWKKLGSWETSGKVREKSGREEGDRRRRRRRGEVDWDELPTLIIWENVGRGGQV